MRVGLISYNGQARDAVGNHLAEKLAFFVDRGADVRVFLQTADRLHPALARHVVLVDQAQARGPAWEFLEGADLVIVDFAVAHDLVHFLPLLAGGKPRLVLEYHGVTPPRFWMGPQRALLERSLSGRGLVWCADHALVHSRFTRGELVRATGFSEDRVLQIDFPLDARFHPGSPQWSLREHLGLQEAALVLYVGRLAANKCIPVLIEALARLRDRPQAVHAVVLGDATDVYGAEQRHCRDLGAELHIPERVHFLGSVADDRLADCYRDADVFVMPSLHEGFCVPVLEAMACGLAVIVARNTALPETVGGAGLTFAPGDADDLARQISRVLDVPAAVERIANRPEQTPFLETMHSRGGDGLSNRPAIAVVSFRFGADIVGGAETSLRKIAHALTRLGRNVEVFTTCTRAESAWTNELPAGTTCEDGLLVHRFPIDGHDRERHLESVRQIADANGNVEPEAEQAYLEHSIHSGQLLASLRQRIDEFEAILVGPYLFGLTCDIAQEFPEKALLLSCFHEEPLARLKVWPKVYGRVGGILYHSPEEQDLAESELGINHPHGVQIGTFIDEVGGRETSDRRHGTGDKRQRYVVYCGRYSSQKDVPRLLDFAARYQTEWPERFTFAFMGQGEIAIPKEDWAKDLGRVEASVKRAVLAGAAALVQLSRKESLSLVALEAWAEGTPVLVDRHCPVLAGQVRRSGGGMAIGDFAGFTDALNDLWTNAEAWRQRGRLGRSYVQEHYGSESAFAGRLLSAIAGLHVPLHQHMRQRGLARARHSTRLLWRERFGRIVEQVLDAGARPLRARITVMPFHDRVGVNVGSRTLLVPVRVHNQGTHAACADGPSQVFLSCTVDAGHGVRTTRTPLPGLLLPGQSQSMAVMAAVPAGPGEYRMRVSVERQQGPTAATESANSTLIVGAASTAGCTAPFLDAAHQALVEIEERRTLPDDYLDVTEGWCARWKRWIKRKLLGNLRRGYIDVLSRQQSQVNRQMAATLQQLTECCATLDHALGSLQKRLDRMEEQLERPEEFRAQEANSVASAD